MKNILILLFFVIFYTGCSKKDINLQVPAHSLNAGELINLIEVTNNILPAYGKRVNDAAYVFPTREWIANEFSQSGRDFFLALDKTKWIESAFDCENHSEGLKFWASVLDSNTANREDGKSIACGEYQYITRNGDYHSILFFIIYEENQYKLVFYEGQLFQIVELTPDEKNDCLFYRF